MISQRLKKIGKLGSLILLRQSIFLGKNLYHLIVEPETAIKTLAAKKDKSEIVLLALVLTLPTWGYLVSRVVWDKWQYGLMMPRTGWVFQVATACQALVVLVIVWRLGRGRR